VGDSDVRIIFPKDLDPNATSEPISVGRNNRVHTVSNRLADKLVETGEFILDGEEWTPDEDDEQTEGGGEEATEDPAESGDDTASEEDDDD
jgi:hypothetical protein